MQGSWEWKERKKNNNLSANFIIHRFTGGKSMAS